MKLRKLYRKGGSPINDSIPFVFFLSVYGIFLTLFYGLLFTDIALTTDAVDYEVNNLDLSQFNTTYGNTNVRNAFLNLGISTDYGHFSFANMLITFQMLGIWNFFFILPFILVLIYMAFAFIVPSWV